MRKIQLTPAEVAFCLAIATQRDASKPNRDSRHSTNQSGFGVHFSGVIGEVAFRKVYGGRIDQTIMPTGDKHKPDIVIPDGRKIEVKTSTFTGTDVTLKFEKNELDFEWCSLVQILGWPDIVNVFPIWSKDRLEFTKEDYGHGERLVFRPLSTLTASSR